MGHNTITSEASSFTKGFLASAFTSALAACAGGTGIDTILSHCPNSTYVAGMVGGALAVGATAALVQKLDRAFSSSACAGVIAGSVAVAAAVATFMPRLL